MKIFRKLGIFQFFFLILVANPCYWVKNGGMCVYIVNLGKKGKKKTSKN